ADLRHAVRQPLRVFDSVLAEAHFLLPESAARKRIWFLLTRLAIRSLVFDETWWPDIESWLEKYAEHEPDFADAQLVVASSVKKSRVWTYDGEFKTVWRRLDGSRIPLFGHR